MKKIQYPEAFVARVKALYPDATELHELMAQSERHTVLAKLQHSKLRNPPASEVLAHLKAGRVDFATSLLERVVESDTLVRAWFWVDEGNYDRYVATYESEPKAA